LCSTDKDREKEKRLEGTRLEKKKRRSQGAETGKACPEDFGLYQKTGCSKSQNGKPTEAKEGDSSFCSKA